MDTPDPTEGKTALNTVKVVSSPIYWLQFGVLVLLLGFYHTYLSYLYTPNYDVNELRTQCNNMEKVLNEMEKDKEEYEIHMKDWVNLMSHKIEEREVNNNNEIRKFVEKLEYELRLMKQKDGFFDEVLRKHSDLIDLMHKELRTHLELMDKKLSDSIDKEMGVWRRKYSFFESRLDGMEKGFTSMKLKQALFESEIIDQKNRLDNGMASMDFKQGLSEMDLKGQMKMVSKELLLMKQRESVFETDLRERLEVLDMEVRDRVEGFNNELVDMKQKEALFEIELGDRLKVFDQEIGSMKQREKLIDSDLSMLDKKMVLVGQKEKAFLEKGERKQALFESKIIDGVKRLDNGLISMDFKQGLFERGLKGQVKMVRKELLLIKQRESVFETDLRERVEVLDMKLRDRVEGFNNELVNMKQKEALFEIELGDRLKVFGQEIDSMKQREKLIKTDLSMLDKKMVLVGQKEEAFLEKGELHSLEKEMGELRLLLEKEMGGLQSLLEKKNQVLLSRLEEHRSTVEYGVRDLLEEAIERHAADGIGRPDYAIAVAGASVIAHSPVLVVKKERGKVHPHQNPTTMLSPSFGQVGEAFCMAGSNVWVEIKLSDPIVVEAITLEYAAQSVTYLRGTWAPKNCKVTGWLLDSFGQKQDIHFLAEFTYLFGGKSIQTFNVSNSYALSSSKSSSRSLMVEYVRLQILDNYGAENTCIYRFRVHGRHDYI